MSVKKIIIIAEMFAAFTTTNVINLLQEIFHT